jgi:hypothetical protein
MRSAAHRWRVIGLAAIASIVSAPALAQFAMPDAVVRELYAFYGVGQNQKSGFPIDPATLKRFFDQRLLSASPARMESRPPEGERRADPRL